MVLIRKTNLLVKPQAAGSLETNIDALFILFRSDFAKKLDILWSIKELGMHTDLHTVPLLQGP